MSENKTENKTEKKFSPFEVSWLFVQEYYTIMNNSPEKLHQFYNKDSYYCNGSEGESSKIYHGQTEINKRIKELEYEDCKVLVSNVDSQISSGDGIIIQVLGEMSNKGGASHKFAQTFFLAKQPNGYFVLNDIIRFLKEDIENEYEDFETPNETYNTQDQYMENQSNTMMTEEVIEQMNESLVLDADTNLEEKTNLESMETHSALEEKKVETETMEEKRDLSATTTTPNAITATTTNTINNSNELNATNANANITTATPASTTTPAATTTTSTSAPATELTESATETEPKRANQVKSFATVTASNTTATSTTTHYKEVSKIESKPLPSSTSQKNNQGRGGRQDQKGSYDREIFIKDINENISKEKIKEAFSKFGEVKKVDVFYNRRSGFVEFISLDSAKSAIAAKSVLVDGHKIIAEEKHKRKGFNNSYNNRNRNEYRDRGYQSGKNGSYVNRGKSIRTK